MEPVIIVIVLSLIAIVSTLSYYYLRAKRSGQYGMLEYVERVLWTYLAIFFNLAFDWQNNVGFGMYMLIAAVIGMICWLIRMLVVMCAKKLWRAE